MPRRDPVPLDDRVARDGSLNAVAAEPSGGLIEGHRSQRARRAELRQRRRAVIGVNPATDNVGTVEAILRMLDTIRERLSIPTQICVLAHVTTQMQALERGAPFDLMFQSVAGTEMANAGFGVNLAALDEAWQAARELQRGQNVMYFETGQGSALSAGAHHGVDQQTCEARAYAVARRLRSAVSQHRWSGSSGRSDLWYRRQADSCARAWRTDFCGKLLGRTDGLRRMLHQPRGGVTRMTWTRLPADFAGRSGLQLVLWGCLGLTMLMLHYQSTSFHDAL